MRYISKSPEDTFAIGFKLGEKLKSGDSVLLYGELGAGKSVFARGCARALGVRSEMASPSFTLMQPYDGDRVKVYHFDLYRLSDRDELYYSGLEEKIASDAVSLIEWPQQADVCPERRVEADIETGLSEDIRIIEIEPIGMDDIKDEILSALKPYEAEADA